MGKRLRSLFRVLTARDRFEAAMTEEMRFHLEEATADLIRSGLSPAEAARRARKEFGPVAYAQEDCREARGLNLMDDLTRQVRYASRMLRKSPAFTVTALLTLAICLGANLTIFTVIDTVLLRPLPFPTADRLVTMFNSYPKAGVDRDGSSITNYYERRGTIDAFESIALYQPNRAIVGEPGATQRELIQRVTPDFFPTLALPLAMGRTFSEEETHYSADDVAIVTDQYWRQRLNADPDPLDRTVRVDGVTKRVVGVLPPEFRFLSSEAGIYLPLSTDPRRRLPSERHNGGNFTHMIGRLKPGVALAEAQAQVDSHNVAMEAGGPEARAMERAGFRTIVDSLHADHVSPVRPTLVLLQAGALVLLLTGLVNLVNLLLVRANGRTKELAVRQALGAGQRHLLAEVLVETAVLLVLGGLLGFAAAFAGIRLLTAFDVDRLPLGAYVAMDGQTVVIGMAGLLIIGLALAAPIAWFNIRRHPKNALQAETRGGTANPTVQRLRNAFLVAQVALAVVLLAGAGLLTKSLQQAMAVVPGFHPENILTGQISLPGSHYAKEESRLAFLERVTSEMGKMAGVREVGFVTNLPFSGFAGKSAATVKGYVPKEGEPPHAIYSYGVGGDYFQALGVKLQAGRFLTGEDSARRRQVCVVDEDFAKHRWPDTSPIGQRLWQGFRQAGEGKEADLFTVVGVVGRVKQAGLTEEAGMGAVYFPYFYRSHNGVFVAVRTVMTPDSFAVALQKVVRQIDPDIPVSDVRSMETRITSSLTTRRSPAMLAGLFSAIALLLTAIGTYGVLSYSVAQRRREIGVRMALGAEPAQIRRQFLLAALRLLVPGTLLGLLGAMLSGQAMRALLFQVPALNVGILTVTIAIMACVSLAASLLPAHRAAQISPLEGLAED